MLPVHVPTTVLQRLLHHRGERAVAAATFVVSSLGMVTRNVHEERPSELCEPEREHVRPLAGTPEFKRSAREGRKVEMLFAHLRRNLEVRRLRL